MELKGLTPLFEVGLLSAQTGVMWHFQLMLALDGNPAWLVGLGLCIKPQFL